MRKFCTITRIHVITTINLSDMEPSTQSVLNLREFNATLLLPYPASRRPSRHGNVPPSPLEIRAVDLNWGHIASEGQAPANTKESNPLHTESVALSPSFLLHDLIYLARSAVTFPHAQQSRLTYGSPTTQTQTLIVLVLYHFVKKRQISQLIWQNWVSASTEASPARWQNWLSLFVSKLLTYVLSPTSGRIERVVSNQEHSTTSNAGVDFMHIKANAQCQALVQQNHYTRTRTSKFIGFTLKNTY